MSYLEMAKQAEARLRTARPSYAVNAINAESDANRVNCVNRVVGEALPFLGMSLAEFQARGALLEVRVRWLDISLWMVPAETDVAALMAEGVSRGRIWTAMELMQLMAITDRTPETVRTITQTKVEVDGQIAQVRRRGSS